MTDEMGRLYRFDGGNQRLDLICETYQQKLGRRQFPMMVATSLSSILTEIRTMRGSGISPTGRTSAGPTESGRTREAECDSKQGRTDHRQADQPHTEGGQRISFQPQRKQLLLQTIFISPHVGLFGPANTGPEVTGDWTRRLQHFVHRSVDGFREHVAHSSGQSSASDRIYTGFGPVCHRRIQRERRAVASALPGVCSMSFRS